MNTSLRATAGLRIVAKPELEELLFQSPSVAVGTFRCRAEHPLFHDSGPSNATCFVFPRTTIWIHQAGHRPYLEDPQVVTYLNEGQEYSRRKVSPDGDRAEWFGVAPEIATEVLAHVAPRTLGPGSRVFRSSHGPSDPATYLAQRRLVERLVAGDVEPLHVEEVVIDLLARVASLADRTSPAAFAGPRHRHRDFAVDARALIASTIGQRVYLSDLAAAFGCSPFYLCRRFKQVHGCTIQAYRQDLRLRMSLERLRDCQRNLTGVALDLGFSSHSHFTAAFRRQFGMTPSAFLRLSAHDHVMPLTTAGDRRPVASATPATNPPVAR